MAIFYHADTNKVLYDPDQNKVLIGGCSRVPTHVTGSVTFSFTNPSACSFSGAVDFDDDIAAPDPNCCTSVIRDINVSPLCDIHHLLAAIYLQYDSDSDVWNIGVTITAIDAFFVNLSAASTSLETAAGGCSTTSDNPTILGPSGNVSATLDYTPPPYGTPDATGTVGLTFT